MRAFGGDVANGQGKAVHSLLRDDRVSCAQREQYYDLENENGRFILTVVTPEIVYVSHHHLGATERFG